jgi:deoxyribonuclease V
MMLARVHPWRVTPKQAIAIQENLRDRIITRNRFGVVKTVAGIDASFEDEGKLTRAAIVVLEFPSLELREVSVRSRRTTFPYVPGLLSFRELPAVLGAVGKLKCMPDLLLCDGQGIAHPRRFGIASHLGLLLNLPSVGVGKTRLVGAHEAVPDERGAWQPLMDNDEVIGAVLRTRSGAKPVYISVGHRISLRTAIDYVMRCTTRYRLPETTRQAHKFASVTWK